MSTKVKFSGFTNLTDVLDALELGIDYIGFMIEIPTNIRSISIHNLKNIVLEGKKQFPKNFPKIVAITSNLDTFKLRQLVDTQVVDIIQFNGSEQKYTLSSFYPQTEVWKAIKNFDINNDISQQLSNYKNFVHKFVFSITGQDEPRHQMESDFIKIKKLGYDIILSGELEIDNIKKYIEKLDPAIIDICNAIEDRPGQKSKEKMKSFLETIYF